MAVELIWPVEALLGEGPLWQAAAARLWFTDIKAGHIHCFTPADGTRASVPIGGRPSFILPARNGFIVGRGHELLDYAPGAAPVVRATIAMPPGNRTNDGCVDPAGRLWFGTMDDGEQAPSGRIYCYDGALHARAGECPITNGPAASPDGRWLYHVDTLARRLWRHALHDDGTLGPAACFAEIAPEAGYPDGIVCDAEGGLWVALWGGAAAWRFAPDGRVSDRVPLPCTQPTKLALGGADYRTAFVTSARIGLAAPGAAEGALFAFDVAVPGFACPVIAT